MPGLCGLLWEIHKGTGQFFLQTLSQQSNKKLADYKTGYPNALF
jgi:hypothetical protein